LGGGGFPNDKVLGGYDFGDDDPDPMPLEQAHGTACAGIAAGDLGDAGDYIGGVAPNAKLYALKITAGSSGSAGTDALVAAWDWCVTHQYDNEDYPILVVSTSAASRGGRRQQRRRRRDYHAGIVRQRWVLRFDLRSSLRQWRGGRGSGLR
jgi:subtilisin family serine protease